MADIEDVDVQTDDLPVTAGEPALNGTAVNGTEVDGHTDVQAEELNFDEQFYPARPARLRPRARLRMWPWQRRSPGNGPASGDNPEYVQWLVEQSMLGDAKAFAKQFTGQGSMWQNPFADPDPRAAIEKASVWFTAYPISMITKPGTSFLGTLGDEDLWEAFQPIGIDGHPHRSGEAGGRHQRLGRDPERRRALRPDQHPDRRGVRHRGRVPRDVRGRRRPRRHDHRRHRARATPARARTSGWPR